MGNTHACKLVCGMVAAWTAFGALAANPADARHCGYWAHGIDMKKVDVPLLLSLGTTDIFLHEYALTLHGQKDVESWIAQTAAAGLDVHIWMQVFCNRKWINPVKDGKPDQALFDEKIAHAQSYARIPGVTGVHLDYVRYPGTAFKTPGGTAAVSEFVRLVAARLHQISPRLVVSAALMPETTENEYYYGQDLAAISKYLDVIIPMVFKENYMEGTPWIRSTTKWYVERSKGARVWAGLQGYKSAKGRWARLPTPEITADAKAALDAGATGVVIFKWGKTNWVKSP